MRVKCFTVDLLVQEFQMIAGTSQFLNERLSSSVRSAREAELADVVGIFQAVDADLGNLLDGYLFVASDLKLMPQYGPDEINIAVVVDRQVKMEASIQSISTSMPHLSDTSSVAAASSDVVRGLVDDVSIDMKKQLLDFNNEINVSLNQLSAVCSQLAQNVQDVAKRSCIQSSLPSSVPASFDNRALNPVIFGVLEDRVATVWRKTVDDALRFVHGTEVDVTDLYRVGRFVQGKNTSGCRQASVVLGQTDYTDEL